MAHNNYHFTWNTTPSGNTPPAEMSSPEDFLRDFSNIAVTNLSNDDRIFLPSTNQMEQNIDMLRYNLGNDLSTQRLTGQNNLLNMTGGMGVNSMGEGFGRRQRNITRGFRDYNDQLQASLQQNMANFRANVLGEQYSYQDNLTSALQNLIRSGESNVKVNPVNNNAYTQNQNTDTGGFTPRGYTGTPYEGEVYFDGSDYFTFTNGQWV